MKCGEPALSFAISSVSEFYTYTNRKKLMCTEWHKLKDHADGRLKELGVTRKWFANVEAFLFPVSTFCNGVFPFFRDLPFPMVSFLEAFLLNTENGEVALRDIFCLKLGATEPVRVRLAPNISLIIKLPLATRKNGKINCRKFALQGVGMEMGTNQQIQW